MEKRLKELEAKIVESYTHSVTLEQAIALAGEFLHGAMEVSEALRDADLDARMKKQCVKSLKAALYKHIATKSDKKPSDTFIENEILQNKLVSDEQNAYDAAEVEHANLERIFGIFKDAHIHFRGLAKGGG